MCICWSFQNFMQEIKKNNEVLINNVFLYGNIALLSSFLISEMMDSRS